MTEEEALAHAKEFPDRTTILVRQEEREALAAAIDAVDEGELGGEHWENIVPEERDSIVDAILAAGFSRPVGGETVTEWDYTSSDWDGSPNAQGWHTWGSVSPESAKWRRRKAGPWIPVSPEQDGGKP